VPIIHSQKLVEFNLYFWIHFRALKNTQKGNLFAVAANAGGRYGSLLGERGPCHAASLFAKATPATLRWVRDVLWASHALRPEDCFVRCCRTARAPCTKSPSPVRVPRATLQVKNYKGLITPSPKNRQCSPVERVLPASNPDVLR